jgi:hypothetical protein
MPPIIRIKGNGSKPIRPARGGVPSPEAIELANDRMNWINKIWFEVNINDVYRPVILADMRPVAEGQPILQAQCVPQIPTPFSHSSFGICVLAANCLTSGRCSLILMDGHSIQIGFRLAPTKLDNGYNLSLLRQPEQSLGNIIL